MSIKRQKNGLGFLVGLGLAASAATSLMAAPVTLLNASFDVARELYRDYNPAFVKHWKETTGETVEINQSHGGSSKQARAVIDGLQADVVTMNQSTDVDAIAEKDLLPRDWRERLPNHGAPYYSTILFLVRKGNPKGIRDWDDLIKPGVSVILPNPKTSGNGRYGYLSAYGFALKKFDHDEAKARAFVGKLFKNVPVFDTGGRGATTTFVQHEVGDVLLTFEAEILLTVKERGQDKFEVVTPSISAEAEMPVAVVARVASRHNTQKLAQSYLEYLYSEEGQEIVARNFFRPRSTAVAAKHEHEFGKLTLFSIDEVFGSWAKALKSQFSDGGTFDQIYQPHP
ncbi:MAG: sulfate transporter substrate-binding protein [Pedosphaera sp.]|nr:sulfate transporter substrate-binding protein [Pedosphaera sp.]